MKKFSILSLAILCTFCSTPVKKSMLVSGKVEGLRKGKLYLQKMEDSLIISIDSITINGQDSFQLGDNINSPEFYLLGLSVDDSIYEKIAFFGEKGEIKINTLLRTFGSSAKIEGSKNQDLWDEYQSIMRKFNNQNLDNYKNYVNDQDSLSVEQRNKRLEKDNQKLLKRKYLYALNFAMNNSDKEIAAYIGTYEVNDAVPLLLDSLYNKLSPEVKSSKYGQMLMEQLNQ